MGATSSIVASRDNNIEMNIADELPTNEARVMKRHSSQPAGQFFASLMLRQKNDGNVRPSVSLRSSGSFDPSSPYSQLLPPEVIESFRKEYEALKLTNEQEIQALQRKEQKMDTENNRLRAELQALNKQCQKLRQERDVAKDRCYEASERAIALEQDREKVQRQFKIFRETKESEIQDLLQAKRQLESKFQRLEAHGMATVDDHNFSSNDTMQNLRNSAGQFGVESEWWAAPESEATSLFGSCIHLQNDSNLECSDSLPDMHDNARLRDTEDFDQDFTSTNTFSTLNNFTNVPPATQTGDFYPTAILRCYVSATPDVIQDAKMLLLHPDLKELKQSCIKEGYCLSIAHFTGMENYHQILKEGECSDLPNNATIQFAVSKCSVFVIFIGSVLGPYTETECQEAHFNMPGLKNTLFCIKQSSHNTSNSCAKILKRIEESSVKKTSFYNSPDDGCNTALKEIFKAVLLEFGVNMPNSCTNSYHAPYEVSCIDEVGLDPYVEVTQHEIALMTSKENQVKVVGLDKSFDRMDEAVSSPGPVPPLLVSGTAGSGKTCLLSSWISRLRSNCPDALILSHFVTGPSAVDADPVILLRRLLLQLCQHLPAGNPSQTQLYASYDVIRLSETLPRWLEQLSSRSNRRIVLVIDSLDLIQDAQKHFNWLLDPLHVGVRVVFSVGVDSCPEEWRQFPTLHLEPLSVQSVKTLLSEHAVKRNVLLSQQWEYDVISHCRTATTCHPLYVTLLSMLVCNICEGYISQKFFHACCQTRDSVELYGMFLHETEEKCSSQDTNNYVKATLQFIACSPYGLSETELMSLVPDLTWLTWTNLIHTLTMLCIIKEKAGFFVPHNSEISRLLFERYVGNHSNKRRCHKKMLAWLRSYYGNLVSPRSTDLLLWLLHEDEERDDLFTVLRSPYVFYLMYSRGRASELVGLWNFLNEEKQAIATYYNDALKQLETTWNQQNNKLHSMTEVAHIYEAFGRFLKDLGLMEEAVAALQRSLEIQETVLDPDHPAIADTLHHLASVYVQWGKLSAAEPLYRQSLELVESAAGSDHPRVAQELSALVKIARKTGRRDYANQLQLRVISITKRNGKISLNHLERIRKRTLTLEELTLGEDSLETAQALYDLGVLYHLQNNLENAESVFKRSVKIREKLIGRKNLEVAQCLHNLGSVYNERRQYSKALDCMSDALTIRKEMLGLHDSSTVSTLKHVAVLYKKLNDHNKARHSYEHLLQISIEVSGEKSTSTANAMVDLAVAECQTKHLDAAFPLYKKALVIYRNVYGGSCQQVSQTLRNIAVLLYQQGNLEEAAKVYKESMGDKSHK
ncbi:nephrocystin-3-like isoform X2 [Clavelina lepadiformis]|uniref:nephrocystin-3-like isoform X2 n=2 Tax=Clavelina lepadiformis TaxID=159417 RepID=UPI004041D3E5